MGEPGNPGPAPAETTTILGRSPATLAMLIETLRAGAGRDEALTGLAERFDMSTEQLHSIIDDARQGQRLRGQCPHCGKDLAAGRTP